MTNARGGRLKSSKQAIGTLEIDSWLLVHTLVCRSLEGLSNKVLG